MGRGTWVEGRGTRDVGRGTWVEGRLLPLSTWKILDLGIWDLGLGIWDLGLGTLDFVAENSMRLSFLQRQLKYTMLYKLNNTSAIHGADIRDYLYG